MSRHKLGFGTVQQQGWKNFFIYRTLKKEPPQPYPRHSSASREYNLGLAYAAEGKTWDGRWASQGPEGEPDGDDRWHGVQGVRY